MTRDEIIIGLERIAKGNPVIYEKQVITSAISLLKQPEGEVANKREILICECGYCYISPNCPVHKPKQEVMSEEEIERIIRKSTWN